MIAEVMKMREEEKKQSSRKIGLKRFFKKRWVYPAIYIGAGAILLSTFLWFQSREDDGAKPQDEFGYENNLKRNLAREDALEVNSPVENFKWPVANEDAVEVVTYFYDASAAEEEQEAAIISDGNSFYPSTGIAIAGKDGKTFEVQAAMKGIVKSVREDALLGNVVTIEHAENIETVYQSLDSVSVKEGEQVKQGQVIGKAGRSLLNEEAGIHTHFEIRKDGIAVNPLEYFKKSLTALQNADLKKTESAADEEAKEEADQSESKEDESDDADSKSDEERTDSGTDDKADNADKKNNE